MIEGEPQPDASAGTPAAQPGRPAEPDESPLHQDRPARFMVIVAHPDDADFGPAATAAKWIAAGSTAWLVCLTSGEAGSDDASADPLELARLREEEQRRAAAIVGYEEIHFLHQPDGALANDLAVREQLVRLIREFRPDAVLCQDPTVVFHDTRFVNHTDHRAAGLAAVDAVYPAARNAMAFPHLVREGLTPHVVPRIYLFATEQPNGWVDTTDSFERKLAALHEHASQLRDPERVVEWVRQWAEENGKKVGVAMADAFRIIHVDA